MSLAHNLLLQIDTVSITFKTTTILINEEYNHNEDAY